MKSAFDEDEEGSGQQPANAAKAPAARVSAFDDDAGLRPAPLAPAPAPVPVPLLSDEAQQRIQAAKEKVTTVAKEGATQAVNATRRTVTRVKRDWAPASNRHLRAVFARGISKRVWMTSLVVALVTVCACIAIGWLTRRQAVPVAAVVPPSVAAVPHAPVTAPMVAQPAAGPAPSVVAVGLTPVPVDEVDEPVAHHPVAPAPIVKAAPAAQKRLAPVSFNPLNPAYRPAASTVQSSIGISKPSTRKGDATPVKKSPERTDWEREQAQKLDAFFKKS